MTFGFLCATILVCFICLSCNKQIARITKVPFVYYAIPLTALVIWTAVQYTGGWEDYVILAIMSVIGLICKYGKFSRPALLIGFILSDRIEGLSIQITTLYNLDTLITRPLFIILVMTIVTVLIYGINRKTKLEYT